VIAEITGVVANMDDYPAITKLIDAVRQRASRAVARAGGNLSFDMETPEFF
jgi:hypothetical protein